MSSNTPADPSFEEVRKAVSAMSPEELMEFYQRGMQNQREFEE